MNGKEFIKAVDAIVKEKGIDNVINNSLNLIELLNEVASIEIIDFKGYHKKIFDISDLNTLYEKSIGRAPCADNGHIRIRVVQ